MKKMTKFRPCIDIHQNKVKQIVGGSLTDAHVDINFVSEHSSAYYAELYQQHGLKGGHLISLGQGNDQAVKSALKAYPDGLQYGGGVNLDNAKDFLQAGATHVIVTSFIFEQGKLSLPKLHKLCQLVGKSQLVIDLSCRKIGNQWFVATDRWQTITDFEINTKNLEEISQYAAELLIHAADVEGLQAGVDEQLITFLSQHVNLPTTYAGGARNLDDLYQVAQLSSGKIDVTVGSALDIFGGTGVSFEDCICFNTRA